MLKAVGQGFIRCLRTGRRDRFAAQINDPGLRRVTQTRIGAALIADLDLTGRRRRDLYLQPLAINRLFSEELVAVGFALWQRRLLCSTQTVELQAFLIQVVAVGDLPEQLGFTGFQALGGENERFIDRQKIRFVSKGLFPAWARPEIRSANSRKI